MKKIIYRIVTCAILFLMVFGYKNGSIVKAEDGIAINETNFPDENFRNYVKNRDLDCNSYLSATEISRITSMYVDGYQIESLKGIEYFTNLKTLSCNNNYLMSLDLSANENLTSLYCQQNAIKTLKLPASKSITSLICSDNQISGLDFSKLVNLTALNLEDNGLSSINISSLTKLESLNVGGNNLTEINISANPNLKCLGCNGNQIKTLNIPEGNKLETVEVKDNLLTSISWKLPFVTTLDCRNNAITTLNISNMPGLKTLRASDNKITSINFNANTNLEFLYIGSNKLQKLDLSKCSKLYYLEAKGNELLGFSLDNCPNLKYTYISGNERTLNLNDDGAIDCATYGIDPDRVIVSSYVKLINGKLYLEPGKSYFTYNYRVSDSLTPIITININNPEKANSDKYNSVNGVTSKKNLSLLNITLANTSYKYTGSERRPYISVVDGDTTLRQDVSYTVTYSNNINVGTAKVIITGKGEYQGTVERTFAIKKATPKIRVFKLTKELEVNTSKKIKARASNNGDLTYTSSKPSVIKVTKDGTLTALTPGTAKITISVASGKNYNSAKSTFEITSEIKPVEFESAALSKNKAIKVKWKTNKNVNGYEIQYCNEYNFAKPKTVTVKKNTTSKKTIKLKEKSYYLLVRIRCYVIRNGKKYYSEWSSKVSAM